MPLTLSHLKRASSYIPRLGFGNDTTARIIPHVIRGMGRRQWWSLCSGNMPKVGGRGTDHPIGAGRRTKAIPLIAALDVASP